MGGVCNYRSVDARLSFRGTERRDFEPLRRTETHKPTWIRVETTVPFSQLRSKTREINFAVAQITAAAQTVCLAE